MDEEWKKLRAVQIVIMKALDEEKIKQDEVHAANALLKLKVAEAEGNLKKQHEDLTAE